MARFREDDGGVSGGPMAQRGLHRVRHAPAMLGGVLVRLQRAPSGGGPRLVLVEMGISDDGRTRHVGALCKGKRGQRDAVEHNKKM